MIYTTTNRTTTSPERWPSLVATFPPFLVFVPPASPFSLSNRFFVLSIVCLYIPFCPFLLLVLQIQLFPRLLQRSSQEKVPPKEKIKDLSSKEGKKKKIYFVDI